jgi:hypothetical protein
MQYHDRNMCMMERYDASPQCVIAVQVTPVPKQHSVKAYRLF